MNGCSAQAEQIQPKKREHIFFNHEYEVNLQKRFPGDATSYILWMSYFNLGQIIYLGAGKI